MSKQRKPNEKPSAEGQGRGEVRSSGKPAVWVRWLVSLGVVWHLFVVFISPMSVPPASQLVVELAQSPWLRWYSDSLYLNHGYHFFGPDPPVNQLVRYTITDEAGQVVTEGEFPNTDQQWPRLLYHRHMMLADQSSLAPGDIPAEDWRDLSLKAYGRHLLRVHGGEQIRVECVRHVLLFPLQVTDQVDPNTPDKFIPVASIEVNKAELDEPLPVPAAGGA